MHNSQTNQAFWVRSRGTPFKYHISLLVKFWNKQSCRDKEGCIVWLVLDITPLNRRNKANPNYYWYFLDSKSHQWLNMISKTCSNWRNSKSSSGLGVIPFRSIKTKTCITHKRTKLFEWDQGEHLLNIMFYYWWSLGRSKVVETRNVA